MQVNLIKLIKDLSPTFLRDNKLVQIIFVLISEARTSFNQFMLQVPDWKYKACSNASVLSLQKTIQRELDVDCTITESDGKPVDFLVTMSGNYDEGQVRKVIDNYKLSGKSYVFENGAITYTCEFINYVCVLTMVENLITVTFSTFSGGAQVIAERAVTSDLIVICKFELRYLNPVYYQFEIHSGYTQSSEIHITEWKAVVSALLTEVTPSSDTSYDYVFDKDLTPI